MSRSLRCRWDGERFTPEPQERKRAAGFFVSGGVYVLDADDPVSHKERGFYHASIKNVWDNLDDKAKERYRSADDLRKWALIKAGWRTENTVFGPDEAWATRTVGFNSRLDEFMVTVIVKPESKGDQWCVRIYRARTQKVGNPEEGYMTREEWKQSNDDILAILSNFIGVTRGTLEKESRSRSGAR